MLYNEFHLNISSAPHIYMTPQKATIKRIISNRDKDLLLGRDNEIELFKKALDNRETANCLSFYGLGGDGKSKLLDAFKKI